MILSLAWRNIWRQRRRTLLNISAIALTCGLLIFLPALQVGSYQAMVNAGIGILDGPAQIQKTDYLDTPSMRASFKTQSVIEELVQQDLSLELLAQRGNGFALLSSEKRSLGAQITGVEPEKETYISSIPKNIKSGRYLNASQKSESNAEIIVGEILAKNLGLSVGDKVTLLGSGRDGSLAADSLTIVGTFTTGLDTLDRLLAQVHIKRFQETFSMPGEVHALVVKTQKQTLLDKYPESLSSSLAEYDLSLRDWQSMQPDLVQAIKLDISSAVAMYIVLILVIVFSLLNSSLMSVLERTREFGMMMALGVKPGILGRVVWLESILIALLGLLAGLMLGSAITLYYQNVGITFSDAEDVFKQFGLESTIYPLLNNYSLLIGPAVIGFSLFIAGIYPGLRIRKLEIVSAMRAV